MNPYGSGSTSSYTFFTFIVRQNVDLTETSYVGVYETNILSITDLMPGSLASDTERDNWDRQTDQL